MHPIQYMYPAECTKSPIPSYRIQLFFSFPNIMKTERLSTSPHLSMGPILRAFNPSHIHKFLKYFFNPLNVELNPICHLLALLGTRYIFHVSGLRVNTIKKLCFIFGNVFQNDVRKEYLILLLCFRAS